MAACFNKSNSIIASVVCGLILSGCSSNPEQMSPDEYSTYSISSSNRLAYDIAGRTYKDHVNFENEWSIVEDQKNAINEKLLNPVDGGLIQGKYGYSADLSPVVKFYKQGDFSGALSYNAFLHSKSLSENQSNSAQLISDLEYRGQLETSQLLLDNGYAQSAQEVLLPVLSNVSTENGHAPFEDIQAINNRIIAEALIGNPSFVNDARKVNVFQSAQYNKYRSELSKNKAKPHDEKDSGIFSKVSSIFKNQSYEESVELAKQVSSPYVNSSADFLTAYANEVNYISRKNKNEAADWSNVRISLSHVYENVIDKEHFDVVVEDTKDSPETTNYKVIYVLVAADIAPSKEINYTKIPLINHGTSVSLSNINLVPEDQTVHSVSVDIEGKPVRTLSMISSPASFMAKDYVDHYDVNLLKQVTKSVSTAIAAEKSKKKLEDNGNALAATLSAYAINVTGSYLSIPETDSWQSMPANIYATRLVIPEETEEVVISTDNGLVKNSVKVSDESVSFIYARAVGNCSASRYFS